MGPIITMNKVMLIFDKKFSLNWSGGRDSCSLQSHQAIHTKLLAELTNKNACMH